MNSLKSNSDENRTYYNNIRYTHKNPLARTPNPFSYPLLRPLTSLVIDGDDHGERGAQGDDAGHRGRPGPLAVLNLHPAVHVVTCNTASSYNPV